MKSNLKIAASFALLLCVMTANAAASFAQRGPRDPIAFLKHAIGEAGAPALTTDQETQLNTLITNFKNAQPTERDAALTAAREAYNGAVLAGDLAAAETQAALIVGRLAELNNARLRAEAKFEIDVLTLLKNGGQLEPLIAKFGADDTLRIVGSLVGQGHGGGHRGPGGPNGPGGN